MSIVKTVCIWVGLGLTGLFVFKHCLAYDLALTKTEQSISLSPLNSRALIARNTALTYSKDDLPEDMEFYSSEFTKILRQEPINDDVFLNLALLDFKSTGKWNRKDALLLALERNPRNRNVLRALVQIDLAVENFPSALSNLDLLMTLKWKEADDFFPILSAIYTDEIGKKEVLKVLYENPDWKFKYIIFAIQNSNENNILDLLPAVNAMDTKDDIIDNKLTIETRYLTKLVNFGYLSEAYNLWGSWNNIEDGRQTDNLIIDPYFNDPSKSPPFNWLMQTNLNVNASRGSDGLFSSFSGRKVRRIMRQVIPVNSKSDAIFSSESNWTYKDRQGYFEWRAYCARDRKNIMRFSLNEKEKTTSIQNITFNLDKNQCDFIDLELWGIPGPIPSRLSILVKSVKLNITEGLLQE